MTTVFTTTQRTRSLLLLIVGMLYYEAVEIFASWTTLPIEGSAWFGVAYDGLRLALLLIGFYGLKRMLPLGERTGESLDWQRGPETKPEIATGAAIGWGMVVVLVLAMAALGGLQTYFDFTRASWLLFFLTLVATALGAAVRQMVFAGFPFRRLVDGVGPTFATILVACSVVVTQSREMQGSKTAMLTVLLLQVLFCVAALRTRSLWLGWAVDVAARLSLGALFGLPVAGSGKYSSVILANSQAAEWLSGGMYGVAGSLLAPLVVVVGIYLVIRATKTDVIANIRPGGVAVNLEERHAPSYPAVATPAPAGVSLVQIVPVAGPVPSPRPFDDPKPEGSDTFR